MAKNQPQHCKRCEQLEKQLQQQAERIAEIEAKLAKAQKNSTNSSKPPSSDIAKGKGKKADKGDKNKSDGKEPKRKPGGQPGHPKHEHRSLACHCDKIHTAPISKDIRLIGPGLTTLVGYLKGACHCSFSTLFKIDASRGSKVLLDVLGTEFNGLLGCDYFSAYRKYMRLNDNVLVQFCLAHFIRDIKFLLTHPNRCNQAYAEAILDALRDLFGIIHRREDIPEAAFKQQLEAAGDMLTYRVIGDFPDTKEAQNLANRFLKHGVSYLQFITNPEIEPTNNLAEQAVRFVVIDRRITQGLRSEAGQRWLERIWTTIATYTQQGRSVFEFLEESVTAFLNGRTGPSLMADSS